MYTITIIKLSLIYNISVKLYNKMDINYNYI